MNIPVVGGSLLEKVVELISYGKQIGELEKEKRAILKAAEGAPQTATRAQSRDARHRWMQVVGLLVGAAALAKLDQKAHDEIFGALEREEQVAAAKQRAKRSTSTKPQ